jgi:glyoxylase-like metal-dependent hydrolase (beta-lactamase superfamily II)
MIIFYMPPLGDALSPVEVGQMADIKFFSGNIKMKKYAYGDINEYVSIAGNPFYPAYVVKGRGKNLMIDAGINLLAPLYIKSLTQILGDFSKLNYLFTTHSHYDHLGSIPYIKNKIPGLITGGSPKVNSIIQKESVISRMNILSDIQRPMFREITGDEDVRLETFSLNMELKEGDRIDLGGLTCVVYETPGHTKDSMSYYIPEIETLFHGECLGVPEGKTGESVQVEFLSSFDDYINSIKKIQSLNPKILCHAHGWIFTEEDVPEFIEKSINSTFVYRKLIEEYIDEAGGDVKNAILLMIKREYEEKGVIYQEKNAYIANLTAQVTHIAFLNRP